jgi:hypothetical protein
MTNIQSKYLYFVCIKKDTNNINTLKKNTNKLHRIELIIKYINII